MPGPAPGAGLLVEGSVVFFVDETREGGAAGEAAGAGEGLFDLNQERLAGVGETSTGAGEVAAVVEAAASFFLYLDLATLGDVAGLVAGAGDVAAVVEAAASFFLCLGFVTPGDVAGLEAGDGD